MAVRFVHTSDLHLGKRFGQFPEELRGRLTEARHKSIEILSNLAKSQGANLILVAGDVFDTGTPSPAIIRQSLRQMAADPTIRWVLLPGNHDSMISDQLWHTIEQDRSDNIILATKSEPIEISSGVFLLPAPCLNRRPGHDLTEWMSSVSLPTDCIRIGLAHGPVQSFGEDGASDIITPDRSELAGLDYLALGDWHGQIQINKRTWYSGTPEPDRHKHDMPGQALVVSIVEHGALPEITAIETGYFNWNTETLSVLPGENAAKLFSEMLPEVSCRRNTLLSITLEGRIRFPERLDLEKAIKKNQPDFAWLEAHSEKLGNELVVDDLDNIDKAGALRTAAEVLLTEAQLDSDLNGPAATALSLLYMFAQEDT